MSQTTQERNQALLAQTEEAAFPRLTSAELALVRPLARPYDCADSDVVFRAGQPDIDLYVVESGRMEIRNPTDGRLIAVFEPGNFSGGFVLTGPDVLASGLWPRSDREPCPLETSVPGVLAAGDIRAGSVKRVGFAVGDGSLAVACAHRLVSINR